MTLTNAIVTAYCACRLCCGPHEGGPTASGVMPRVERTIAAPPWVPFGATVVLPGKKTRYRVEDRTAKRYADRFDVFVANHKEAQRFGLRKLKVQIQIQTYK